VKGLGVIFVGGEVRPSEALRKKSWGLHGKMDGSRVSPRRRGRSRCLGGLCSLVAKLAAVQRAGSGRFDVGGGGLRWRCDGGFCCCRSVVHSSCALPVRALGGSSCPDVGERGLRAGDVRERQRREFVRIGRIRALIGWCWGQRRGVHQQQPDRFASNSKGQGLVSRQPATHATTLRLGQVTELPRQEPQCATVKYPVWRHTTGASMSAPACLQRCSWLAALAES
jgi:hypothetical protein